MSRSLGVSGGQAKISERLGNCGNGVEPIYIRSLLQRPVSRGLRASNLKIYEPSVGNPAQKHHDAQTR